MRRKIIVAVWMQVAIVLLAGSALLAQGPLTSESHRGRILVATVSRVVDGDTLRISTGEAVRLIGVDTPETVDPRKPVQRFGKEACAFTRRLAEGKTVRLEFEGASITDKYGRILAYVWLPDGKLLNAEIIRQGYGHAYVQYPFARMEAFRALEKEAREKRRGLWADSAPAKPASKNTRPVPTASSSRQDQGTVYITNTGSKYHRDGCRYLKSRIPMQRAKAIGAGYEACKVCRP